jgi:hypothetical protein
MGHEGAIDSGVQGEAVHHSRRMSVIKHLGHTEQSRRE